MGGVIKFAGFELPKKGVPRITPEQQLLEDIRTVCQQIDRAYARFEYEEDGDLVEAAIYDLEALKARYRYLIRLAKEQNITSDGYGPIEAKMRGKVDNLG